MMKRLFTAVICLALLAAASAPAFAQGRRGRYEGRYDGARAAQQRRYDRSREIYRNRYDDRSVWEKHRDKLTVAGGTAAGAVIGGLAGGKKGAIIGAIAGAGGSALYTYKVRERNGRRY